MAPTHLVLSRAAALILGSVLLLACAGKTGPQSTSGVHAPAPPKDPPQQKAAYAALADQLEQSLQKDIIRAWFPRCVDRERGGFHANWGRDWAKRPSSGSFIVYESRQTWITAQIAMRRPDLRAEFLEYTRHGLKYLDEVMWDKTNGGFYWGLETTQKPGRFGTEKQLYGEAFGIYAAAASYEATKDAKALDLAVRGFKWLDQHAHDAKNGGYFEIYAANGDVIHPAGPLTPATANFRGGGFIHGTKSMNAHIHLLEALAQLHRVWPDPLLKKRLAEVQAIVRDRIAVEPGCLNLWFTYDWRAVPDHDSFGHDVETGFLLLEAAEELGMPNDAKTLRMARMLVDHALDWGFDHERGGLYDKGYAFTTAFDKKKVWWSQVEAMNAFLLMHELYGGETDRYWKAFQKQCEFVQKYQIDSQYGGLYPNVEADGKPTGTDKGNNWKAAYHDGRSFLIVIDRLRRLAK